MQDRCEILLRDAASGSLLFADNRSGTLRVLEIATGIQTVRGLPQRTFDLIALDRPQQSLKVAFAEARVAPALDKLEKHRS